MFKFKVDWFDPEEQRIAKVAGIASAKTYDKAIKEIMKYFGEEDLSKITLEPVGDGEEALVIFSDPEFDLNSII